MISGHSEALRNYTDVNCILHKAISLTNLKIFTTYMYFQSRISQYITEPSTKKQNFHEAPGKKIQKYYLGQKIILGKLVIAIRVAFGNDTLIGPKYIPLGPINSFAIRSFTELSAHQHKFQHQNCCVRT